MLRLDKVYHGDCMRLFSKIDDESVDMILTDIPYGEVNNSDEHNRAFRKVRKGKADGINFGLEEFVEQCIRVCSGSIYIFCGIGQVSVIRKILIDAGLTTRLIIWEKTNPTVLKGEHLWLSGIECCVFGRKLKATFNEHCKNTVLRFHNGKTLDHPTEKPADLMSYLVRVSSNKGDTVLDPCAGSGVVGVVCKRSGRRYILIEKDKEYFDMADKWVKETKKGFGL